MRNFNILEAIPHAPTHTRRSYWRRRWKQLVKKRFNELESTLFQKKKKKKQSETLQPGHPKTLRLSSRNAPAQWNILVIYVKLKERRRHI